MRNCASRRFDIGPLLCSLFLMGTPAQLRAQEPEPVYQSFSLSAGIDLSSGAYDQEIDTDTLYLPFSFTYERGPWLARITLPFLGVRGPGDVQGGVNDPLRVESDFGIGDIYVDASYYWTPVSTWLPSFEFGAQMKIPSASREDNLGTGEADYALGLDLSHWFGNWTPFARVTYRFLGDNEDYQLNDGFTTSVGVQYRFNEKLSGGIIYDWRQSTNDIQADPQEISPYASYRATEHVTVTPYTYFGLTSSSVDVGGGLTVSYRF